MQPWVRGTDLRDEVRRAVVVCLAEGEQPVQRIVLCGDKAIETCGGVVDGLQSGCLEGEWLVASTL